MTLVLAEAERMCPAPAPEGFAPFPGPEWEEEDDLSVEWDEDWAWDGDGTWEDDTAQPGGYGSARSEAAP